MRRRTPRRLTDGGDASSGLGRPRRSRSWPGTVLVMQADTTFWDSLVFDGIDDVYVDEVTAAFGTVDIAARSRRPARCVPTAAVRRTGCTAPTSAD